MSSTVFGSYIDTNSFLHKTHPFVKALAIVLLTISTGYSDTGVGLVYFFTLFSVVLYLSKINVIIFIKAIIPLLPVIVVSFVSHYFFGLKSVEHSVFIVSRLMLIVFFSSMLTFLIKTDELTALFYHILCFIPFVDAKGLSISLGSALGFVPLFVKSFLDFKDIKKVKLFSVKEFLAPLSEKALKYTRENVEELFQNFDERIKLPKIKIKDYTILLITTFLSVGWYCV